MDFKLTAEKNFEAEVYARRMLEMDPDAHHAVVQLGWILMNRVVQGYVRNTGPALDEAMTLAERAIEQDADSADALCLHATVTVVRGDQERALASARRSAELAPNAAQIQGVYAMLLMWNGDHGAALVRIRRAIRLGPHCPAWMISILARTYSFVGDLASARVAAEHLVRRTPTSPLALAVLVTVCAYADDLGQAQEVAGTLLTVNPDFSVRRYVDQYPYRLLADRVRLASGLLKAGLPD